LACDDHDHRDGDGDCVKHGSRNRLPLNLNRYEHQVWVHLVKLLLQVRSLQLPCELLQELYLQQEPERLELELQLSCES
jgi:hypothetical protein